MFRIPLLILIILSIVICGTSCAGSGGNSVEDHRKRAHANGLPYWEDIIDNCFPTTLGNRKLNRIVFPFDEEPKSYGLRFFDFHGEKLEKREGYVPDKFSGYLVVISYISDSDLHPFPSIMFISRHGLKRELVYFKNSTDDIEKKLIGDFTIYEGRLPGDTITQKWAFYDDFFCLMSPLAFKEYETIHAEYFDELISQLDIECIKSQFP